jgi:hypothetical protein
MARAEVVMLWTPVVTGIPINLVQSVDTALATITTKALDMGAVDWSKLIDQVVIHMTDRADQVNLLLNVYSSNDEDGPFDIDDSVSIAGSDPIYIDPPARKYFKLEVHDPTVVDRWTLHGIEVWGTLGGREY